MLVLEMVSNLWQSLRMNNILTSINIWKTSDLITALKNFIHVWQNPSREPGTQEEAISLKNLVKSR